MGAILGFLVAGASRWGDRPRRSATNLAPPLLALLAIVALFAVVGGLIGRLLSRAIQWTDLTPAIRDVIPPDKHAAFLSVNAANVGAYAAAVLGGLVLAVLIRRSRRNGERA